MALMLGTGSAVAQEPPRPAEMSAVRACLSTGGACIGALSDACQTGTAGGSTTLGITECAMRETAAWDVLLNEEYRAVRAGAKAADAAEAQHFPEFARRVISLRDAQRAWIAFRDAECALAYAEWGSGSMRGIAAAHCQLEMTAERTFTLRAMRAEP